MYSLVPFKAPLFKIVKVVFKPSEKIYKHLHFTGDINVPLEDKQFKMRHYGYILENELFWNGLFGGWEKNSLTLWKELSEQSNTILDIGSNTGVYSLIAKTVNQNASVFAFEPLEKIYKLLEHNIKLNNYDIKVVRKGVSNESGTADMYDVDDEHTYTASISDNSHLKSSETVRTTIDITTIDDFIKDEELKGIDLMKVDVEMHEVEAMQGFKEHIQKFQPTMLIEILRDHIGKDIEEIIKDIDYLYFNVNEDKGIKKTEHLSASDHHNFLIIKKEVAEKIPSLKGLL